MFLLSICFSEDAVPECSSETSRSVLATMAPAEMVCRGIEELPDEILLAILARTFRPRLVQMPVFPRLSSGPSNSQCAHSQT